MTWRAATTAEAWFSGQDPSPSYESLKPPDMANCEPRHPPPPSHVSTAIITANNRPFSLVVYEAPLTIQKPRASSGAGAVGSAKKPPPQTDDRVPNGVHHDDVLDVRGAGDHSVLPAPATAPTAPLPTRDGPLSTAGASGGDFSGVKEKEMEVCSALHRGVQTGLQGKNELGWVQTPLFTELSKRLDCVPILAPT